MSAVPIKDGFNSGFDKWIDRGIGAASGLFDLASQYEGLRQQRDNSGQGQQDLSNAVLTDTNPNPVQGTRPAGEGNFANINNQTLMIVGTALSGIALIVYLIRK